MQPAQPRLQNFLLILIEETKESESCSVILLVKACYFAYWLLGKTVGDFMYKQNILIQWKYTPTLKRWWDFIAAIWFSILAFQIKLGVRSENRFVLCRNNFNQTKWKDDFSPSDMFHVFNPTNVPLFSCNCSQLNKYSCLSISADTIFCFAIICLGTLVSNHIGCVYSQFHNQNMNSFTTSIILINWDRFWSKVSFVNV